MKHVILSFAVILALGASAVTTTLEYEDLREARTLESIKNATNDLDRALSAKIEAATPADYEEVKSKSLSAIQVESDPTVPAWAKAATKPTYTAAEVGALPLVEDANGQKTAVTIGSRRRFDAVGEYSLANGNDLIAARLYSHAEGSNTIAAAIGAHAEGSNTIAEGDYSHTDGVKSSTRINDDYAFAWNGDDTRIGHYTSHGPGTFNINPLGGLAGLYIGDQPLAEILTNKADTADISATNPTFSNAVLAVGLNIDTNSVAILNEIAETFGGFPIEGAATTVGGLLASLAAAVAWLKKNKADKSALDALASKVDAANAALEEVA